MSIAEFMIENGINEDYPVDQWIHDQEESLSGFGVGGVSRGKGKQKPRFRKERYTKLAYGGYNSLYAGVSSDNVDAEYSYGGNEAYEYSAMDPRADTDPRAAEKAALLARMATLQQEIGVMKRVQMGTPVVTPPVGAIARVTVTATQHYGAFVAGSFGGGLIHATEASRHIIQLKPKDAASSSTADAADDNSVYVLLPNDDRPGFYPNLQSGLHNTAPTPATLMSGTQIMAQFLPVGRAVYAMVTACEGGQVYLSMRHVDQKTGTAYTALDYPDAPHAVGQRVRGVVNHVDEGQNWAIIDLFDFGRETRCSGYLHSSECHLDCELKLGDVLNNLRVVKFDDGPKGRIRLRAPGGKDWQNKEPELKKMRKMRKMWKDEDRQGNPKAKKRMRKLDQKIEKASRSTISKKKGKKQKKKNRKAVLTPPMDYEMDAMERGEPALTPGGGVFLPMGGAGGGISFGALDSMPRNGE